MDHSLSGIRLVARGSRQQKVELENAPSPASLSESEESSSVDQRLKDKIICGLRWMKVVNGHQHANRPGLLTKNQLIGSEGRKWRSST